MRLCALALALSAGGPASAHPTDRWAGHIAEASGRFGVPRDWIARVMMAESGGRTWLDGRPIQSHAGALGLMQLMPGTWLELRARLGLGTDPHDPRDNILAGTAYLASMHARFGYPGLFAAYNAGPARYAEHLATGRRLPGETVAYVRNVTRGTVPARRKYAKAPDAPSLFAIPVRRGAVPPRDAETSALFVPVGAAAR